MLDWDNMTLPNRKLRGKTTRNKFMNRSRFVLATLGLLLLAAPAAQAQFTFITNGGALTVTGYSGPGGVVAIPASTNGLPVTSIGNGAFSNATNLASVTIPGSVKTIGDGAFEFCASLTNVTISNGVTRIGDYAFYSCTNLTSVTMAGGVTSIGEEAFYSCASLTHVTIPGSVTSIGGYAFYSCANLTNVTMANGVTSIGKGAFLDCSALLNVTIPGSVKTIGDGAFEFCVRLANVTIPGGVKTIGDGAFEFCSGLLNVTIPGSVTSIGEYAFYSCAGLTNVTLDKGVTSIGTNAFADCSSLAGVYFKGNAPTADSTVFGSDTNATVYYLPDTTGWSNTFAGRPAVLDITRVIKIQVLPANSDGIVGGAGLYIKGSNATLTASPASDCFLFTGWTAPNGKVITNNPYIFTVTNNETLTASFEHFKYTISTSSSPANGGNTSGGGKWGCGTTAELKAAAKPGFVFQDWTSGGILKSTNAHYAISVGENESFVAHFKDIQPPKIGIIAPTAKQKVATASMVIYGEASDNVGVSNVCYNLNNAGWARASLYTEDGFLVWYSYVTLKPDASNTLSVYAVDTGGKVSATNTVKFNCAAAGLAPLSIASQYSLVDVGTNASDTFCISFDSAAYLKWQGVTNNGGEVGTYTYTPTGPDTAELVWQSLLPTRNTNSPVLELTFTNAYNATFTNLTDHRNGIFYFEAAEQIAPSNLDGYVAVMTSYAGAGNSTNSFASATFTRENNQGGDSGSYTFTPFTQVGALLVETSTNAATDYMVFLFTNGAPPASGYYFSEMFGPTNQTLGADIGIFSTSTNRVTAKFVGPVSLAGLQASITSSNGLSFTRSFGNGAFASISTTTNEPSGVGVYLAGTRVTTNTGVVTFLTLDPPYAAGKDEDTVDITWKTGSSAKLKGVDTDAAGTLTLSKAHNFAPAALTGRAITVTPKNGTKSTLLFTNNFYTNSAGDSGTYTYAPYTPTMALVTATRTNAEDAGTVAYLLLNYQSLTSGACVASKLTNSPGGWEIKPGGFKMQ